MPPATDDDDGIYEGPRPKGQTGLLEATSDSKNLEMKSVENNSTASPRPTGIAPQEAESKDIEKAKEEGKKAKEKEATDGRPSEETKTAANQKNVKNTWRGSLSSRWPAEEAGRTAKERGTISTNPPEPSGTIILNDLDMEADRVRCVCRIPRWLARLSYGFLCCCCCCPCARERSIPSPRNDNAKQFVRDTRELREKIRDDKGWEKFNYYAVYWLAMALIIAQLIASAIITALGAFGHEVAVTTLGGINVAMAGILAVLKGSGLPERRWRNYHEYLVVGNYIDKIIQALDSRPWMSADQYVREAEDMYQHAIEIIEQSRPDFYASSVVAKMFGGKDSGAAMPSSRSVGG